MVSKRLWRVRATPAWIADVLRRESLRRRYGFDRWHVRATAVNRPYKGVAARLITDLGARTVVDVGCGLGDLGGLLPTNTTYLGLDLRPEVVAAANEWHRARPNLRFAVGSFEQVTSHPDVLVALNWIDGLPSEILAGHLSSAGAGRILLDAVSGKQGAFDHRGLRIPGYTQVLHVGQHDDPRLDRALILFERAGLTSA